jgi:ABC-type antimicrobial peptide transport system permease subunit
MRPVLVGAVVGGAAALLLADSLADMLHGVAPTDPATLAVTLICLVATALLACMLPARRATRIAPFVALSGD